MVSVMESANEKRKIQHLWPACLGWIGWIGPISGIKSSTCARRLDAKAVDTLSIASLNSCKSQVARVAIAIAIVVTRGSQFWLSLYIFSLGFVSNDLCESRSTSFAGWLELIS